MKIHLRRLAVLLTISLAASPALAQRLIPPTYYSFSTPVLQPGETAYGTLTDTDGQNFKDGTRLHVYFFDGAAGDEVQLQLNSQDFDTWLTVYTPDGVLYDWNDDDWDGSAEYFFSSGLYMTLPQDGRYFAIVTGYSASDLGDYELTYSVADAAAFQNPLDPANSTRIELGESYDVVLEEGMPITGEGYFGPSQLFELVLEEDTLVVFESNSETVDSVLMLFAEDGTLHGWNDTAFDPAVPDAYLDSRLLLQLNAGRWYLVLGGYAEYDIGDVTLTVTGYLPID